MRKTHSTPCFLSARRRPSSAVGASGVSPPSPASPSISASASASASFLVEHVEQYVPSTIYQFAQCMELYGPSRDILKAPHPRAEMEDSIKSVAACILTPDEPNEPMRSFRPQYRLENLTEINERFDRLFLSIRRQRRRQTI
jgi:hypothetical protein